LNLSNIAEEHYYFWVNSVVAQLLKRRGMPTWQKEYKSELEPKIVYPAC
jgi:hypothetical protein